VFLNKFESILKGELVMVMTVAEDMKKLVENIITSHDVRVKTLGTLVADTHKTLKGFEHDRKKMAAEQAKSLADFVKGLTKSVEEMLKGFEKNHEQMSKEQAKNLADFVTNLAADVGSMLSDFQKARGEMSEELKDRLAKEVKEIETYVANKLKEFNKAHAGMSKELRKDLADYAAGIAREMKKVLTEYSSDMAQAKKAWKQMCATLAKARKAELILAQLPPRFRKGRPISRDHRPDGN